jgi:hypothetical protein
MISIINIIYRVLDGIRVAVAVAHHISFLCCVVFFLLTASCVLIVASASGLFIFVIIIFYIKLFISKFFRGRGTNPHIVQGLDVA